MNWKSAAVVIVLACAPVIVAFGDELTQIVQQDLTTLGYDTGETNGTASTKTIIAVSKFQSEHNMEVTGEITPQLAGVIKAAISQRSNPANAAQPAATTTQTIPVQSETDLKARQQACLQEKAAAAEKSNSMKRGLGKLLNAVSRTTSQYGAGETASAISTTTSDVYSTNASISDLEGAAKDLGITESDVEACRNP